MGEYEATPLTKWILRILVTVLVIGGLYYGVNSGLIPTPGFFKPKVIETNAEVAAMQDQSATELQASSAKLSLPSTEPASTPGPRIVAEFWAWNAQMGCLLSVGGPSTTRGSLMEKYGVNMTVKRQDDTPTMMNDLVAYAKAYAQGDHDPSVGVNMVAIMGSQGGGFFQSVNTLLAPIGDTAEVVHICGRSDGEDAVMGPPSWKQNPRNMIGSAIFVVKAEGDADLLKKYLKDNKLPFNPSPETFDSSAVNIIDVPMFTDAAEKFVAHYCEPRKLIKDGKLTGKTVQVCGQGVSTWTPADVSVARGRGGLVRIVSTADYPGLMPNTVIVLKRWANDNRETLVNAISAFGEGSMQVLTHPEALNRACEISAQIYQAETPEFWCKYYRGTTETDATGLQVQLGGSRVSTLADNERWFGLIPGSVNVYRTTYNTFGNMLVELYPTTLSEFPSYEKTTDVSFLQEAIRRSGGNSVAEQPNFRPGFAGAKIANRSWDIQFQRGSAEFSPKALSTLNQLLNELVESGSLVVEVNGHTDNTGTAEGNQILSERRANHVKEWLEAQAPVNFPNGMIRAQGFGQSQPVASNATEAGQSQNRRVEITLRRAQ